MFQEKGADRVSPIPPLPALRTRLRPQPPSRIRLRSPNLLPTRLSLAAGMTMMTPGPAMGGPGGLLILVAPGRPDIRGLTIEDATRLASLPRWEDRICPEQTTKDVKGGSQ